MEKLQEIPRLDSSSMPDQSISFMKDMPEFLRQAGEQSDGIIKFRVVAKDVTLVTDPALLREVLVTRVNLFPKSGRDVYRLSRFIGRGLVTANGADHKRQRKMAQPAFHARRIENYAETMVGYSEALMADWDDGQALDIAEEMMALTMYIVGKTLFDTDMEALKNEAADISSAIDVVQELSDKSFDLPFLLPLWVPTQMNRRTKQVRHLLDATIKQMVQARRAEAVDGQLPDYGDLLSMLMLAKDENGEGLTDTELVEQLLTLFLAGHETTSNALTWTWYLLSQHPDIEAKMHAEIDAVLQGRAPMLGDLKSLPYVEMVLKESMRLFPPVWGLNFRQAAEDTHIGPYRIKKGEWIVISPYASHRNSTFFDDPALFDPERFSAENEKEIDRYVYFPFGAGPRVCIGQSFAMMEAILILATLGQRYRFELSETQMLNPISRITLSNEGGMHVRVIDRERDRDREIDQEKDLVLQSV